MVRLAQAGSPVPALVTAGIAVAALAAATCALGAAGVVRVPFARAVTAVVTAVYLLRGAALVAPLVGAATGDESRFVVVTSLVSLAVGAVHAAGLRWA